MPLLADFKNSLWAAGSSALIVASRAALSRAGGNLTSPTAGLVSPAQTHTSAPASSATTLKAP